jgi:hypothetical protein
MTLIAIILPTDNYKPAETTVNSQLSGILRQLAKILNKIYHFIKSLNKKAVTDICSPTTQWFSQPLLVALSVILPHTSADTVVVMRDCSTG